MKSLFIGLASTLGIILMSADGELSTYFQKHSMILVVGGTFTILLFSTPDEVLRNLWKAARKLRQKDERFDAYTSELVALAGHKRLSGQSRNPLIDYANQLWEQGVDNKLFTALLSQKRAELESEAVDSIQTLKNLAKYPPALGMAGTVMGMIALFSTLDQNRDNVGHHLAIAMTATLFGLLMTNALIGPLGDRLQVKFVHQKRLYNSIYQILLLINQDQPVSLITDELKGRNVA